jgi:orotidine-5'-phosphate decarboxylase
MSQAQKSKEQKPNTKNRQAQLIVALDVDNLKEAGRLVDLLYPVVKIFKIGSQLFTACGPEAINIVKQKGGQVFLDLKYYDIPNTVYQSVSVGTASAVTITPTATMGANKQVKDAIKLAVFMITVHIRGGREMLEAAVRGATEKAKELNIKRPFIVGVTRLTSDKKEVDTEQAVLDAARLAKDAGLDGVVCSVHEAKSARKECGDNFLIVTPGIRPAGFKKDDQSRVATAKEAVQAGADFLVVGRPIIQAQDPLKAAKDIVGQIL